MEFFQPDVREIAAIALERYGAEEWNAVVLTCELHRHLGIYSILGAKMGIYAREMLEASLDELHVTSYAGNKPPLSCFNDGLQVSTGATLGQGMINIIEDKPGIEAAFSNDKGSVRLQLKGEIAGQISADIENALQRHGGLNKDYFAEIRKIALRFWLEQDRNNIFSEIQQ